LKIDFRAAAERAIKPLGIILTFEDTVWRYSRWSVVTLKVIVLATIDVLLVLWIVNVMAMLFVSVFSSVCGKYSK